MAISREQVTDLQPGDVVEVSRRYRITIAEVEDGKAYPWLGDGSDPEWESLTVVSRAPRLYVNHPRTSPVPGDVVRDADSDDPMRVWLTSSNEDGDTWWVDHEAEWVDHSGLPARLRLLVDGETGRCVQ